MYLEFSQNQAGELEIKRQKQNRGRKRPDDEVVDRGGRLKFGFRLKVKSWFQTQEQNYKSWTVDLD